MIKASVCTIGDEILIGQIVDTNSSAISRLLQDKGVKVSHMVSVGDSHDDIVNQLSNELANNDIVIVTGGLGPTKDDITRKALMELSGSESCRLDRAQAEIIDRILSARGLQKLKINSDQALVPENCEVINNKLGTAPVIVVKHKDGHRLYSLPGVPYEALGAMPDILNDIDKHFSTESIYHKTIMVYGLAESALSELIAPWEDTLPDDFHLSYLPNQLTGIRLRLSAYGAGPREDAEHRAEALLKPLREILGIRIYSEQDDSLQAVLGRILTERGETVSAAESCTGGEIAHLFTSVSGSSKYFLGSVTSYAVQVKEKVLGVPHSLIGEYGVVSSQVAASMAEGVRRLTGSTYAVSTTGLAEGSDGINPEGTVWIGVSGPVGTMTRKAVYKSNRIVNIQRFAATALDFLRIYILDKANV